MKRGFLLALLAMATVAQGHRPVRAQDENDMSEEACPIDNFVTHVSPRTGKKTPVYRMGPGEPIFYESGMTIDADGAPNAYHPSDRNGLDSLKHAGTTGNWWALLTDKDGEPIVRQSGEYRGFYVSMTWLHHHDKSMSRQDPDYWVDARTVPYLAIPKSVWSPAGVKKGDLAMVINEKNGRVSPAIVADWGTEDTLGEGSIALGEAMGLRSSDPRVGGVSKGIAYVVFPGSASHPAWPRPLDDIAANAYSLWSDWGGISTLDACRARLG